jgi:hypothetical protein
MTGSCWMVKDFRESKVQNIDDPERTGASLKKVSVRALVNAFLTSSNRAVLKYGSFDLTIEPNTNSSHVTE